MSDISIDAKTIELANNIKTLVKEKYDYDIELLYVDHHATTTEFDRMADWVHSSPTDKTETSGVLRSACYQLYNILFKDTYGSIEEQKPYDKTVKWTMLPFVNIGLVNLLRDVSAYDTGREWRNNPEIYKVNRFRERYVALLSYGLGGDGVTGPARLYNNLNKCWFKYLILGLIHPDTPLRDIDKIGDIIKIQEDQIETSRQLAIRNYVQVEGQDIGLAGIYAHANIAIMVLNHGDVISETMEAVCQHQRRNHVNDIVIGIQVPYRTIQLRRGSEKYDLSVLAKDLGGGGHPAASGFRCSTQYLMMLLTTYFNEWDRTNFA